VNDRLRIRKNTRIALTTQTLSQCTPALNQSLKSNISAENRQSQYNGQIKLTKTCNGDKETLLKIGVAAMAWLCLTWDSGTVTDRLRRARTVIYRNSFIPYCLSNFD